MKNKSEQLAIIEEKLRKLDSSKCGDTVFNHIEADNLLIETIELLSSNTIDKPIAGEIIKAFRAIDRLYA